MHSNQGDIAFMGSGRSGSNKTSSPRSGPAPVQEQNDPAAPGDSGALLLSRPRAADSSWGQHWKGLLVLVLALQPLVAMALAGAYMHRHMWREWIQQLSRGGFHSGGRQGGLGVLAPREPTVVYYGPDRISLGDFSVYMYDPVTKITLRANFRVDTTAQCDDRQAFEEFVYMFQRLVREQVMVAVRNASLEELTDPEHQLLKRRILTQVNRMLDQPFLKSVDIKNFSLWESVDQMSFLPYQPPQPKQTAAWQ